jgi:hypothetical protein
MRNPPILISVIGFFAVMAGFAFLFLGLRLIGFDWFGLLGDQPQFENAGLWGWLAVFAGVAWLAAGAGLWAVRPWAWAFAMIMAGISLFEAFLLFVQYPGSLLGLGAALLPGVILLYLNSRDVKAAFGLLLPDEARRDNY